MYAANTIGYFVLFFRQKYLPDAIVCCVIGNGLFCYIRNK